MRPDLDSWQDVGAWWDGEPERRVWRVETAGSGRFDLWETRDGTGQPTRQPVE